MKVLVIEDEAPAYRRLIKLISECDPSAEVVGVIQSVKDGMEWFRNNALPDLILSDIQLADDLSFTIFRELKINVPIIFITAYDEYAINAFKFFSIDYLLKPVGEVDLRASLSKYKMMHQPHGFDDFEALVQKLTANSFRERFLVYQGDSLIPLHSNNIAYFTTEDGTTLLVTNDNKRYFMAESLDTLEGELNPKLFHRANRQFILSLTCIEKIHNYGQQKLKIFITPGATDPVFVSKLKATQFKKWLNR
ncbi:MAG: response regulator transcription factor [Bacteroidales bacterium]|nr:response regulator transcription factor [Bacteroidales bacterium]